MSPAAEFLSFAADHPREASLVQTVVTRAIGTVELDYPDLTAVMKHALAEVIAVDLLCRAYRAGTWFGANPTLDFIAIEYLIPLIPKAIEGIITLLAQADAAPPASGPTGGA